MKQLINGLIRIRLRLASPFGALAVVGFRAAAEKPFELLATSSYLSLGSPAAFNPQWRDSRC